MFISLCCSKFRFYTILELVIFWKYYLCAHEKKMNKFKQQFILIFENKKFIELFICKSLTFIMDIIYNVIINLFVLQQIWSNYHIFPSLVPPGCLHAMGHARIIAVPGKIN